MDGALFSLPEDATYTASRAAAANTTQGLRVELDRDPILVAGLSPAAKTPWPPLLAAKA